ncbi:MAG: ATP-binding cassette domain-containing protein [Nitrospinota bacterium]
MDPQTYIWQLSVGEQQRVEILKALYRKADILILDEPTSVLTPQETGELFHTLRAMTAEGMTVIFITHNCKRSWRYRTASPFSGGAFGGHGFDGPNLQRGSGADDAGAGALLRP